MKVIENTLEPDYDSDCEGDGRSGCETWRFVCQILGQIVVEFSPKEMAGLIDLMASGECFTTALDNTDAENNDVSRAVARTLANELREEVGSYLKTTLDWKIVKFEGLQFTLKAEVEE